MLNRYVLSQECEGGTLLYNSINGAACIVPATKDALSGYLDSLDPDEIGFFRDNLFLETSAFNEKAGDILTSIRTNIKYSNRFASFTIHLNYNCNLRCSYCYQNDIRRKKVMSRDVELQLYEFFEKVKKSNRLEKVDIAFIGGEPLLRLDAMLHMVQEAARIFSGVEVDYSIVTNGTLFTEEVVRRIREIPFKTIQVTLDGSRDVHDRLRMYKDGTPTYEDILENLAVLQDHHLPVVINCNLDETSYRHVDELYAELVRRGIAFPVFFSMIFDCESSCHRQTRMTSPEYQTIWLEVHEIAAGYGYKYPPFYRLSYMVCGVEKVNDFNVSPGGQIYKCLSGMEKEDFFLADLGDYGTPKYYNRLAGFVEYDNRKEKCFDCKYLVVCGGWCRYKKRIYGEYCPYEELENNDLPLLETSDWR